MSAKPNIDAEQLLVDEHARSAPLKRLPPLAALEREFIVLGEDRYQMNIPGLG